MIVVGVPRQPFRVAAAIPEYNVALLGMGTVVLGGSSCVASPPLLAMDHWVISLGGADADIRARGVSLV